MKCFRRGCYFANEKPLKFFKKFTKNNCRSECLANKTMAVCGCTQFYMVRGVRSRVCGVLDMKCYKKVEEESQEVDWCDCLLECGEIEYKTEQQQNDFVMSVGGFLIQNPFSCLSFQASTINT
jgi:acid-sensing ion channel, other